MKEIRMSTHKPQALNKNPKKKGPHRKIPPIPEDVPLKSQKSQKGDVSFGNSSATIYHNSFRKMISSKPQSSSNLWIKYKNLLEVENLQLQLSKARSKKNARRNQNQKRRLRKVLTRVEKFFYICLSNKEYFLLDV